MFPSFTALPATSREELEIFWDPNRDTLVEVQDELQVKDLEDLLGALREDPSVRDIYLNSTERF